MGIRSLSTASISTGTKRSKVWDQSAVVIPPSSFESIATVSLSSAQASVTFSSIPSTYKHLQVRMISRDSNADTNINSLYMNFNGVTGTSYSWHKIEGLGSGTPTANGIASQGNMWIGGNTANNYTSGIYAAHITDIHDYTNTSKYKTIKTFGGFDTNGNGVEPGHITLTSGMYMSTDAITSITIFKSGQNQLAGSHFALYGIKG